MTSNSASKTTDLRLKWITEYHGPNYYAATPVVVGELTGALRGDVSQLESACAALWTIAGMERYPDSGSDALDQDGQLILARCASEWARFALNEVRGFVLDSGAKRKGDALHLWIGFHHPELSRVAVHLALQSFVSLMNGTFNASKFHAEIARLWQNCRQHHPDYQARIVMTAARQRAVPYAPAWGMPRYWRFGEGARSRVLFESSSSEDSHFGFCIQSDKVTSKRILHQLGLRTPRFVLVRAEEQVSEAAEKVGFPLVTKPIDRGGGKGVSAALMTLDAAVAGFRDARAYSKSPILIEEHIQGQDHRLMVVDGKYTAAICREAPQVVGDGASSIRQLIERLNKERIPHSLRRSGYLRPIVLDTSATLHLAGLGLSESSVLEDSQSIPIRSNANLSTGGQCIDVTEQVHPHIRELTESLAQTLNLKMMGADYLTTDISRDPQDVPGGFIEFNMTPGLDALIAANWSEERAGGLCLSDSLGPVPKVLLVVNSSDQQAYLAAARQCPWKSGFGWAANGSAALSGVELFVLGEQPWSAPRMLFSHSALTCALTIVSSEDIAVHGAPACHFKRSIVIGETSTELRTLVQSISDRVDYLPMDSAPKSVLGTVLEYLISLQPVAEKRLIS
ncbi:MAG: ATP-grasp domain-containing protein [Yoonia sp.]